MKHLNLRVSAAVILLTLISSFSIKLNNNYKPGSDVQEITPLIENTILLYDTTKFLKDVKYANSSKDYIDRYRTQFLTFPAFSLLITQLENTFNDQKALIYSDSETRSALDFQERKLLAKGRINAIRFFETWYYNKQTGEIIKKQLGYAALQWDYEKEAFREWYLYFTSQDALTKYIKNS